MDWPFLKETFFELVAALPLTIQLATISTAIGLFFALGLALCRTSSVLPVNWFARLYIYVFRGTPLLIQIFVIYYGLGQFEFVRNSALWVFLREPYWCAILALTLNTAAYGGEVLRGGLFSVPAGQIEAARACGMSKFTVFRRVILPLAVRQALPGYSNELIAMVKSTSLVSLITLMEVTGVAARIISETYRLVEVFTIAGGIYLAIIFLLTRGVHLLEYLLSPHLRAPRSIASYRPGSQLINGDSK